MPEASLSRFNTDRLCGVRAGVKSEQDVEKSAQDRYGTARQGRPHSGTIAREWPSILAAAAPNPTSIVLQAITRSMLYDTSPHSVRSMAFSIYSKAAGRQLAGPTPAAVVAPALVAGGAATATQVASDTGAHRQSAQQPLNSASGSTAKATDTAAAASQQGGGSAKNSKVGTESILQQKQQPALLAWAGCSAGAPAFRVAEHQQSCTLASAAAEPAADPDLGKVLRKTDAVTKASKPGSDTDKQHTPMRCASCACFSGLASVVDCWQSL